MHDFPYSPHGSPFIFEKQQQVFVLFNTSLDGSTGQIEQSVFLQYTKGARHWPFTCACVRDAEAHSLLEMIAHLKLVHQGSVVGFNSSLGRWHKTVSHCVVFAALFDSAAVTAVLPSFLQVLGISREHYLCANEDYDTAGCN